MQFKKVTSAAVTPKLATNGSAGYDISASIEYKIDLKPGVTIKIPTGLAFAIPHGFVGLLMPRSGLALMGITLANDIGVIDSDYRDEIQVVLVNNGTQPVEINHGMRIAQLVVLPIYTGGMNLTNELPTANGNGGFCGRTGGFGSTGISKLPE